MNATNTRWTQIEAAREGDGAAQRAFATKYGAPLLAYLRRRGFDQDAEDLSQQVWMRLFAGGALARAAPGQGRFRDLLLAVTKHVVTDHLRARGAIKRGGAVDIVPLEVEPAAAAEDEVAYDREWLLNLLELALARLEREHPVYHEALRRFLLEGSARADVAAALGTTDAVVRNRVHRGKAKLIGYLREEVWNYSSTREELGGELGHLARLLEGPAG